MFYARLLVRRLFGGPLPPEPEFDARLAITVPALRELRDRARAGDWRTARKLLDDAGEDWDLRSGMVAELAAAAGADDRWLYDWLRTEPFHPVAVLVQAEMLSSRAGTARGGAPASETSAEQFADFHELSAAAAQLGRRAVELSAPNDPLPWTHLLGTMFADRGAMTAAFETVYAEGQRRDPHNLELHLTAIILLCQKWYGSHEQMFALARAVAAAAPPGHNSVLLPLVAHFEYAMREFAWNTFTSKSLRACKRYFRRADVRQDIEGWIAKYGPGTPTSHRLNSCLQWMAIYYSLAGRQKEAKAVFDRLGQFVTPALAWSFFWGSGKYGYRWSWWWANGVH